MITTFETILYYHCVESKKLLIWKQIEGLVNKTLLGFFYSFIHSRFMHSNEEIHSPISVFTDIRLTETTRLSSERKTHKSRLLSNLLLDVQKICFTEYLTSGFYSYQ